LSFAASDSSFVIAPHVLISSDENVGVFGSTFNELALANYGSIIAADDVGAEFSGDDIIALNGLGGLISGTAGITFLGTDRALVTNEGTINAYLTGVSFVGTEFGLANGGTIAAAVIGVFVGTTSGRSEIVNDGTIAAIGAAIQVSTTAGLTTRIQNDGVIHGGTFEGEEEGGAILSTSGSVLLDNYGEIEGDIRLSGDAVDYIANYGEIWSEIRLGEGNDIFQGAEGTQLFIFGEGGNDGLIGGFMDEFLDGGDGDDVLDGGLDNDVLTGGAGADQFVFTTVPNSRTNRDFITDFSAADGDKIHLDTEIYDHLGGAGTLQKKYFEVGNAPENKKDRIIYNEDTGTLTYAPKGSKSDKGDIVKFAQLDPGLDINHKDFVLF
jgi:Ca2+-binding RTX toxin-like protein